MISTKSSAIASRRRSNLAFYLNIGRLPRSLRSLAMTRGAR